MSHGSLSIRRMWRLAASTGALLAGTASCSITTDLDNLAGTPPDAAQGEHPWWSDASNDGSLAFGDSGPANGGGEQGDADAADDSPTAPVDATTDANPPVDATPPPDTSPPVDAGKIPDAAHDVTVDTAPPPPPVGSQLVVKSSNKCLEANGTRLTIATCNDAHAQFFQIEDLTGGHLNFVESRSNACVALTGSSDGTAVELAPCDGSGDQVFQFQDLGNGFSYIVNNNAAKCVEAVAPGTADGTAIDLSSCHSGANQEWKTQ